MSAWDQLAAGVLTLFQTYAMGGTSWTGTRTSGDGIASALTTASLDAITMYVLEEMPSALARALAGQQIAHGRWWGLAGSGSSMQIGDIRTDGTSTFRVMTIDTMDDLKLCQLERQ